MTTPVTAAEIEAMARMEQPKVNCQKCSGYGWLRGRELDNPSEDTYADTMTKYPCDGDAHKPQAEHDRTDPTKWIGRKP